MMLFVPDELLDVTYQVRHENFFAVLQSHVRMRDRSGERDRARIGGEVHRVECRRDDRASPRVVLKA